MELLFLILLIVVGLLKLFVGKPDDGFTANDDTYDENGNVNGSISSNDVL